MRELYSISEEAVNRGVSGLAVSIGVGLLGILYLTYSLSRPLRELRRGIRGYTRDGRLEPIRVLSKDELGELGAAFNDMKCLGALDRFILRLFLLEAGIQGLAGSLIGALVGLAIGLATGLARFGTAALTHLAVADLAQSLGFSILVGAGLSLVGVVYPAIVAARMRPVEAMVSTARGSWGLALRVYNDVEKTQRDVLLGVLFYIALFIPFAYCVERVVFNYVDIHKRIAAFLGVLLAVIAVVYKVHPAFRLTYSPLVVILAFFILGLSVMQKMLFVDLRESLLPSLFHAAKVGEGKSRKKLYLAAILLALTAAVAVSFVAMSRTRAESAWVSWAAWRRTS